MKPTVQVILALGIFISAAACSSAPTQETQDSQEVTELRSTIATLNKKVETLENKVNTLGDAVQAARVKVDHLPVPEVTIPESSSKNEIGIPVEPTQAPSDPEAGFTQDSAIQAYRQGLLLRQSGNHSEAILAFSSFLERNADHPLAGSAQFFIGEAYLKQNEYKLAAQELERVLAAYAQSPKVPETLRLLADAEDALKRTESATQHRQTLLTLFPRSPSALLLAVNAPAANSPVESNEPRPEVSETQESSNPGAGEPKIDGVPPQPESPETTEVPPPTAPEPAAEGV